MHRPAHRANLKIVYSDAGFCHFLQTLAKHRFFVRQMLSQQGRRVYRATRRDGTDWRAVSRAASRHRTHGIAWRSEFLNRPGSSAKLLSLAPRLSAPNRGAWEQHSPHLNSHRLVLGELERELMRERVTAGLRAAKAPRETGAGRNASSAA